MTLSADPAYGQVSAPTKPGQTGVGGRPMLTLTAAAAACAVSRSTLRRRLAGGAFPNAVRDADGAWTVPVGDLLAAGLRINAPQVGRQGQPAVSMPTGTAHPVLTGAGEQAQTGRPKPALAARVAELEWALAVERERREGAERLAAERGARIEDLRVSLRMLEAAPRPAGGAAGWRWWWRR